MNYFQATILAIIEGLTEFLPISSTGHLIIASNLLKVTTSDFTKSFEIIIQLGAIMAIVFLYWQKFLKDWKVNMKVLVAFIPTGFVGLVVYKLVKQYLLDNTALVAIDLVLGGIFLLIFEKLPKLQKKNIDLSTLSYPKAFAIGCIQSISILPGISRAASTIVGGLLMGLDRTSAVEFSFLLAVPTMVAATGLDLVKSSMHFTNFEWSLLVVGLVGSFIVALVTVKYFLKFVQKNNFTIFGIYRIFAGILFWFAH